MIINEVLFNCELEDVLIELNTQLGVFEKRRDSGKNIQVCCPYHNERRPSAGIRKNDGLFNCFACGETHTLPEVISWCYGHTEDTLGKFGWNWLLKHYVTVAVEDRKDVELDIRRTVNKYNSHSVNNGDSDICGQTFISEEELDSYRFTHPYMYKRGLTDDVIERFDIGYDKKSRCITFPIRNIYGQTIFIARRSVDVKYFNYPEGVEKPLYGIYELNQEAFNDNGSIKKIIQEVIICESMLDALSFWTVGKYAVALNGTGSELQFKQLRDLICRKLILCTDMDKAGMKARDKIRKNVPNKLITEYILPDGRKDANECTKEELENLQEIF